MTSPTDVTVELSNTGRMMRGKKTYVLRRGALLVRVDYRPTWLHRLGARLIGARFERYSGAGRDEVYVV